MQLALQPVRLLEALPQDLQQRHLQVQLGSCYRPCFWEMAFNKKAIHSYGWQ